MHIENLPARLSGAIYRVSKPMKYDVSFIILTWNSAETITECLASIRTACARDGISYEVLVVDNGRLVSDLARRVPERDRAPRLTDRMYQPERDHV